MKLSAVMFSIVLTTLTTEAAHAVTERPTKISSLLALGDSVMAGYGVANKDTQVPLFRSYLKSQYAQDIAVQDLSRGGATSQTILGTQLTPALNFLRANADRGVVTLVDAGGNDLLGFLYSQTYKTTCQAGKLTACFEAVNAILDRTEETLNQIFSALRGAATESNPILVLTYANSRSAPSCATSNLKDLFEGSLEGLPGTVLTRGLNTRIRDLATVWNLAPVDVHALLQDDPGSSIAADCIHPNGKGYRIIYEGIVDVFESLAQGSPR